MHKRFKNVSDASHVVKNIGLTCFLSWNQDNHSWFTHTNIGELRGFLFVCLLRPSVFFSSFFFWAGIMSTTKLGTFCSFTALSMCNLKVRVPQLQVDGGGQRRLSCAAQSVHPPGLPGLGRDVDASGCQLRQTKTNQQRTGRPGTRECYNYTVYISSNAHCLYIYIFLF